MLMSKPFTAQDMNLYIADQFNILRPIRSIDAQTRIPKVRSGIKVMLAGINNLDFPAVGSELGIVFSNPLLPYIM